MNQTYCKLDTQIVSRSSKPAQKEANKAVDFRRLSFHIERATLVLVSPLLLPVLPVVALMWLLAWLEPRRISRLIPSKPIITI